MGHPSTTPSSTLTEGVETHTCIHIHTQGAVVSFCPKRKRKKKKKTKESLNISIKINGWLLTSSHGQETATYLHIFRISRSSQQIVKNTRGPPRGGGVGGVGRKNQTSNPRSLSLSLSHTHGGLYCALPLGGRCASAPSHRTGTCGSSITQNDTKRARHGAQDSAFQQTEVEQDQDQGQKTSDERGTPNIAKVFFIRQHIIPTRKLSWGLESYICSCSPVVAESLNGVERRSE